MWLFMELGCYYKISKQKGEKNCYRKKYRFEPEPDLNRGSVQSSARCPNQTIGPVLGSPKMAKNWTELDFGNTTCNGILGKCIR